MGNGPPTRGSRFRSDRATRTLCAGVAGASILLGAWPTTSTAASTAARRREDRPYRLAGHCARARLCTCDASHRRLSTFGSRCNLGAAGKPVGNVPSPSTDPSPFWIRPKPSTALPTCGPVRPRPRRKPRVARADDGPAGTDRTVPCRTDRDAEDSASPQRPLDEVNPSDQVVRRCHVPSLQIPHRRRKADLPHCLPWPTRRSFGASPMPHS